MGKSRGWGRARFAAAAPETNRLRATLVLTLATAVGCSSDKIPIGVCLAPAPIAVIVAVNDSVSGTSVADSARGVAKVGDEVDSLRLSAPPPRLVGGAKLGTYQVIIDRPHYREWIQSGVVVSRQGPCGNTIPVELVARLQSAP